MIAAHSKPHGSERCRGCRLELWAASAGAENAALRLGFAGDDEARFRARRLGVRLVRSDPTQWRSRGESGVGREPQCPATHRLLEY
jgi:hypothetical protein